MMIKLSKKLYKLQIENERLSAENWKLRDELMINENCTSFEITALQNSLKDLEERYNNLLEDYRKLRDNYAGSVSMSVLLLNKINYAAKVVTEKFEEEDDDR